MPPAPSSGTDDVVCRELGILNHLLRPAHGAERDVHAAENTIPMLHRLRGENIIKANGWPADYVDSIERVCVLLDRHGEAEMPRIRAGVLEARGLAFAAGQIRRAVARVEQGS